LRIFKNIIRHQHCNTQKLLIIRKTRSCLNYYSTVDHCCSRMCINNMYCGSFPVVYYNNVWSLKRWTDSKSPLAWMRWGSGKLKISKNLENIIYAQRQFDRNKISRRHVVAVRYFIVWRENNIPTKYVVKKIITIVQLIKIDQKKKKKKKYYTTREI